MDMLDIESFNKGIDFFNDQEYYKAHIIWEHCWKSIDSSKPKLFLKPFIMLTGAYLNYKSGRKGGGDYLLKLSLDRLLESKKELKELVEVNLLIESVNTVYKRGGSTEGMNEIKINKVG